jgi:hypothetical protein
MLTDAGFLRILYNLPRMADRTLTETPAMMTIRTGKLSLFQPLAGELESEEEEEEPSPLPVVDEVEELEPPVAIGPTVIVVVDVG